MTLYLHDLRRWELDHALYERPDLNRRIDSRYQAVIASFVRAGSKAGPVYATQDIAVQGDTAALLARRFSFVPQGLVLQLVPDTRFHEPAPPPLRLRGLTDGAVRLEPDDVARENVLPAVLRMLTLRSLYFEAFHRSEQARRALREADRFRRRAGL